MVFHIIVKSQTVVIMVKLVFVEIVLKGLVILKQKPQFTY